MRAEAPEQQMIRMILHRGSLPGQQAISRMRTLSHISVGWEPLRSVASVISTSQREHTRAASVGQIRPTLLLFFLGEENYAEPTIASHLSQSVFGTAQGQRRHSGFLAVLCSPVGMTVWKGFERQKERARTFSSRRFFSGCLKITAAAFPLRVGFWLLRGG